MSMISNEILESFQDKNILITGGTGLIGRQIVQKLQQVRCHMTVVSLDDCKVSSACQYIKMDLCDFQSCLNAMQDIDYVFHLAGVKGSVQVTKTAPASFMVPLLMMNTNVLEAARRCKVQKLVYTSSIGAYAQSDIFKEGENESGPPMDSFPGLAKRVAEQQIAAYTIQYGIKDFSIVRPCNCYGPGDNFDPKNAMVIPSLMARLANGEIPLKVWGDGKAVRDFAFSRDVAEGIILALYYGTNSRYVNLGSGKGYSIMELVKTLAQFIDFDYVFDSTKGSGFSRRVMDISLAKKTLGYCPQVSLLEGLKETWNWFLSNRTEYLQKQNYFIGE